MATAKGALSASELAVENRAENVSIIIGPGRYARIEIEAPPSLAGHARAVRAGWEIFLPKMRLAHSCDTIGLIFMGFIFMGFGRG
jgi:hypothetical protein